LALLDGMEKKSIAEIAGFEKLVELISKIGMKNNPILTYDWIMDNTTFQMINGFAGSIADMTVEKSESTGEPAKN
jgi:hypothetical protein